LPTSLVSSLVYLSLELYVSIRASLLMSQSSERVRDGLTNIQVLRGLSLTFLEVLTIGPSAVMTTLPGDFIPFALGAIVVLSK
jgi:hypothetical protein